MYAMNKPVTPHHQGHDGTTEKKKKKEDKDREKHDKDKEKVNIFQIFFFFSELKIIAKLCGYYWVLLSFLRI